jgi:hypothetical protein
VTSNRLHGLLAVTAVVLSLSAFWAPDSSAAIALVQKGTAASAAGTTITPTLTSASKAGDLLVAALEDTNSGCASDKYTAPAGWVLAEKACRGGTGPIEIWYDTNASAGVTSVEFGTGSSGANSLAQLSEWSGVATASALDQIGTKAGETASTSLTVSTTGNLASAGEAAITAFGTSAGLTSYAPGSGWTSLLSNPGSGFDSNYDLTPANGASLTETVTSSPQTTWGAVIATFLPACSGGSLTLKTSPTATFPSVTLNGYNATTSLVIELTLSDQTASGSGWNLTGTSTTLTAGAEKNLPTTATTITAAAKAAATGNCKLPTNSVTYPVTLPAGTTAPTAAKLFNAAAKTGEGPTTVKLTTKVALPANTRAGSYSSTWTLAMVSGP